jgi:hypothetical protein
MPMPRMSGMKGIPAMAMDRINTINHMNHMVQMDHTHTHTHGADGAEHGIAMGDVVKSMLERKHRFKMVKVFLTNT